MANGIPKPTRTGLSKDTYLLALTSLFSDISTEMLYPVLPVYLTQVLKSGGGAVGIIEGVATATQFMIQGISGWLSDRLRKHKPVALAGYALGAVSKPLIGLAPSWHAVLGARFLDRLGAGTRSAPRDALIAGSAGEASRGKAFGLEGIGDNLGAFVGPIIAILLLYAFRIEMRSIFYLAVIPGLLAFMMVLFVREKTVSVQPKAALNISPGIFPAAYWKYLLIIAVFGIGNSSNAFLILQTKDAGVPFEATIAVYAAFNLVAALVSYPSGTLSDRFGRKSILMVSFFIFLVTYLGFALSSSLALLAILFILYGAYQGIFRSVGKAFASDFVPQNLRASAIGWYSTVVGLTGMVASMVAGYLWDYVGHQSVFLFGALFAVAGTLMMVVLIPSEKRISR